MRGSRLSGNQPSEPDVEIGQPLLLCSQAHDRYRIAVLGILFSGGLILSGFAGAWLHGRAKGRREGFSEAQTLLSNPAGFSIEQQNERIDSLLLEVTRLRDNQSQMSRVLRATLQNNQADKAH